MSSGQRSPDGSGNHVAVVRVGECHRVPQIEEIEGGGYFVGT